MEYRSAVILCGGKGSRLGSVGKKIPKTLLKIQKETILWFIINILKKNKFNHFILPLGYKSSLIKKYILKKFPFENIDMINTGINSNIAERIFKIKKFIKSSNFLLLNGDAIFDFNISKIFKNHSKNKVCMTFVSSEIMANFGTIGVKNGRIFDFKRDLKYHFVKVNNENNYKAYVYSGISVMHKSILLRNFKNFKNFEKQLYPWVIKNYDCKVESPTGFWHSIDNTKDINIANNISYENSKFYSIKKIKNMILNNLYKKI